MTPGFLRAWVRLLAVQASWNYERMTGIGMAWAAAPLLEDLKVADPARQVDAAVRSAEYFNSHPYLAGLALGALARAEYDRLPGGQIARLRGALTSPLGSLGDQLVWAGAVPAAMALLLLCAALGGGVLPVVAAVSCYAAARLLLGVWALRTGLASGMQVGAAMADSWLPRWAPRAGLLAGALVGLALPSVARWELAPLGPAAWGVGLAVLAAGLVVTGRFGARVTAFRFGLLSMALAALLLWGWP